MDALVRPLKVLSLTMIDRVNVCAQLVASSKGSLAEIEDPTLRFMIAEQGLEHLSKGLGGLIRDTHTLISGAGFNEAVLAVGRGFQVEMRALRSVTNEASDIMERARTADGMPALSEEDARRLESLSERARRVQERIVGLLRQLHAASSGAR